MSIHYAIQHVTRFTYGSTVSESLIEVRMQPRTEARQTCLDFDLGIEPRSRLLSYRDFLGNWVHHFNVPTRHDQLTVTARARVEVDPPCSCQTPCQARHGTPSTSGRATTISGTCARRVGSPSGAAP